MIKDIEFRGKTDDGEWVYGDLMKDPGGFCFIRHFDKFTPGGSEFLKLVQANTIGFHTGLKDKNGKKIFTGDVAEDGVGRQFLVDYSLKEAAFVFKWTRNMDRPILFNRFIPCQKPLAIIGNAHDNPEMVKR